MSKILDSGERRTFPSGSVRDITDGKGRPSLMPLEVVFTLFGGDDVIFCLGYFKDDNKTVHLYDALKIFAKQAYNASYETMMLEVSKHFEDGAKKYGENNWQKGIPVSCYLDSAIRHYLKYLRGDNDEPHDRAFVWNVMCCIWEVDHHGSEA